MRHNKSGQTATEYLIILAVVIIIALIAIGVLGRIPLIGGNANTNAQSTYWATAKIAVTDPAVTPDGNVTLTILNNDANAIVIEGVALFDPAGETNTSGNISVGLLAGQVTTLTIYNVSSGDPGQRYSYSVLINYSDASTGYPYTFTGDGAQLTGIRTN